MADVGRKRATVQVEERLSEREIVPDLWLCAAPIKKGRVDWVAEKACELGVRRFVPVLTRRTVVDRLNSERLRAHMVEAAEQRSDKRRVGQGGVSTCRTWGSPSL